MLPPVTRLSAIALALGCWNATDEPFGIEKLVQLMIAFGVLCRMSVLVAVGFEIAAWPATTWPPVSCACASQAAKENAERTAANTQRDWARPIVNPPDMLTKTCCPENQTSRTLSGFTLCRKRNRPALHEAIVRRQRCDQRPP